MSAIGLALSLFIGISLGFFGGGGSIMTVPLLVYVFGLEPKEAIASSLMIVGAASILGAVHHWRAGNVEIRTGLLFGTAGMAGAYTGGRAGAFIDGKLLLLLFAAMMVLTAVRMWRGRREVTWPTAGDRSTGPLLAQGFAVGSFTGLVGAGGGFLIVPALALWARLPMSVAVGTSLMVIVMNTLAGYVGYASHVAIDYRLVASISAIAIVGSFAGTRLGRRVDPNSLRRAFAGFVPEDERDDLLAVREADLWLDTAKTALPASVSQLAFAAIMLGIGIAAGRVAGRADAGPLVDRVYSDGAGI